MNIYIFLIIFLSLPYAIILIRNLIWDIYLWQVKEYRFDRYLSQIFYEKVRGARSMLSTYFKIGILSVLCINYISMQSDWVLFLAMLSFFLYWYESFQFFPKLLLKKIHRFSIKSPRNMILFIGTLSLLLLPYTLQISLLPAPAPLTSDNVISLTELMSELTPKVIEGSMTIRAEYFILFTSAFWGILNELISPLITSIFILLTKPLAYYKRKKMIQRAIDKIEKTQEVKVIAVTGSYGKSTTKEILFQILSNRFDTIKTEKNNNTDVGIAKTILNKLNKDTEVFVAEMGAYKLKETSDCCRVAKPSVALITGIDQQHLSLYGSIEAVLASTYEVIEELEEGGLVILNGDNEYCLDLVKGSKARRQFYSVHESIEEHRSKKRVEVPDIKASDIRENTRGLQFLLHFNKEQYLVKTNLKAHYNISNLLACILVCIELKIPLKEVINIINENDLHVPYLNISKGNRGVSIIDDGYNANFTGFIAALKHLDKEQSKGKKYILTQGIIELGEDRKDTYDDLAREIVKSADGLITSDIDLIDAVKDIDKKYMVEYFDSVFDVSYIYDRILVSDDILLIEGPFPEDVLKKIYLRE